MEVFRFLFFPHEVVNQVVFRLSVLTKDLSRDLCILQIALTVIFSNIQLSNNF